MFIGNMGGGDTAKKLIARREFIFKGTVSRGRFGFWWHAWSVLGLNRGPYTICTYPRLESNTLQKTWLMLSCLFQKRRETYQPFDACRAFVDVIRQILSRSLPHEVIFPRRKLLRLWNQACGSGSALFWEAGSGSALEWKAGSASGFALKSKFRSFRGLDPDQH